MAEIQDWPTETEAAAQLGTSVKTISRYAAAGKIEMRKRPREGKKPENVVNPRDLEKLMPAAHVMPAESIPAQVKQANGIVRQQSHEAAVFFSFIQTIATAIQTMQPAAVQAPRPWLSIGEAAAYSGLSANFIHDSIVAPHHYEPGENLIGIRGGPHGAWRIQRASLEEFRG